MQQMVGTLVGIEHAFQTQIRRQEEDTRRVLEDQRRAIENARRQEEDDVRNQVRGVSNCVLRHGGPIPPFPWVAL